MPGRRRYTPSGKHRLTPRQIRVLMHFWDARQKYRYQRRKKDRKKQWPLLDDIARSMNISRVGVLRHIQLIIIQGYLTERMSPVRYRKYCLTEKGLEWCRRKAQRLKRAQRKRRNRLIRERNRWLYHHVMRGVPYTDLLDLQFRASKEWPRIWKGETIKKHATLYARRHGKPEPPQRGRPP